VDEAGYTIRRADLSDAGALAQVHEATWRETYAGLMSERMLDALTADAREKVWQGILSGAAGRPTVYVAERAGRIVAFSSCGPQTDQDFAAAGFAGEFTSVYVLKSDQRQGLGTSLMQTMMSDLADRGLFGFTLWVPRENIPARSLYEQLGGRLAGQREIMRGRAKLTEVAYAWQDPSREPSE
jgi:ribosomal protein S18 acetylase RimI-like enzyme